VQEVIGRARILLSLALLLGVGCGSSKSSGMDASVSGQAGTGHDHHDRSDASMVVDHDASSPDAAFADVDADVDAALPGTGGNAMDLPKGCPTPAPNQPPDTLSCTGMYSDIVSKKLNTGVQAYAPAVPLWSDGAEKLRWIYLPPGEKIDISKPDAWTFPIGTKFFKEFASGGKRIETRVFWKLSATYWARSSYRWNDKETEAMRTGGEDVALAGGINYHIPSTTECDQCHKGRLDRALGFEAILLSLPGATGLNAAALKKQGLLTGGTLPANIEVGDDGTGNAAPALTWLHVNCGVSCHNGNSAAEAYSTSLRLDLHVADADGRAPTNFDALKTSVNVNATTGRWLGKVRVVPGSPTKSLLYMLMSTRNATNMKDQMPPIATRVVPKEGALLIKNWITTL
jgi:hypothetical protein